MPRMRGTPKVLSINPLQTDKAYYHFCWIQANKDAFDDYTNLSLDEFLGLVLGSASVTYELGDGVGLCTFVFQGRNAWIQMVVYDYDYRHDLVRDLINRAFDLGATRITTTVTEDRDSAKELVLAMGCKHEGTMRKAYLRNGEYLDVHVYGLLKEEFKWQQPQP
jgi:hypothetical protein